MDASSIERPHPYLMFPPSLSHPELPAGYAPSFHEFLDGSNMTKISQIPAYATTPLPERANRLMYFAPFRNYLSGQFDASTKGMAFQQTFEVYAADGSGRLAPVKAAFFAPQLILAGRS